jgi:superfamily I DNA/RNA helicase
MNKNTRKGRIKRNISLCYRTKHNKFSQDNIIRKIKRKFIESCRKYINYIYKQDLLNDKNIIKDCFLKRINPDILRQIKKSENIKWLNTKLRDVFSVNISDYYTNEMNYNIKNIEKLYKEGKAIDILNLLNRTVKSLFLEYCSNEKKEGFNKLDDDILRIKNEMIRDNEERIEEYVQRYEYIAINFEKIFRDKIERKNRVK